MSFISKVNIDSLRYAKIVSFGDKIAFQNPDGTWLSIQPDGSEQSRPEGTTPGAYELALPIGGGLCLFSTNGTASYIRKYIE